MLGVVMLPHGKIFIIHRFGIQKSLNVAHAVLCQVVKLTRGFHPFCYYLQIKAVSETYNGI